MATPATANDSDSLFFGWSSVEKKEKPSRSNPPNTNRSMATGGDLTTHSPMLNGEAVASLSTCSVNLEPSCNFHVAQRMQAYLQAWRNPAPPSCQPRRRNTNNAGPDLPSEAAQYDDRLGINMEPLCNK